MKIRVINGYKIAENEAVTPLASAPHSNQQVLRSVRVDLLCTHSSKLCRFCKEKKVAIHLISILARLKL